MGCLSFKVRQIRNVASRSYPLQYNEQLSVDYQIRFFFYLQDPQKDYHLSNLQDLISQGVSYFKQGKITKCIEICKRIIQNNPEQQGQFLGLGSEDEQIGFYQGRVKQWFTERFQGNKICPYDLILLCFLQDGRFQEQRKWLAKMSQIHPTNSKLLYGIAVNQHNKGSLTEAQKIYTKIIEIEPNFCKPFQMLGFIGLTLNKLKQYRNYIEKCLSINKNNIYGKYLMASYYFQAKAYDKCQHQAAQIFDLQPRYVRALCLEGKSYLQRQDYKSALGCFEKGLRMNPRFDVCLFHKGQALMGMKNYDESIKALKEYDQLNRKNTQCLILLGKAYIIEGDYNLAQIYLLRCKFINPTHVNINKQLALVYMRKRNYQKAANMYEQVFQSSPNQEQIIEKIIYCYQQLGDHLRISQWAQELIEMNPNQKDEIHLKIAKAQFRRKQYSRALRKYKECLKMNLPISDIYEDIVEIYAIRENFEELLDISKDWLLVQADSDKVQKRLNRIFDHARKCPSKLKYTIYK